MNAKQRKTLEAVFTDPLRVDIRYQDLEAMFAALGAELYPNRRGFPRRSGLEWLQVQLPPASS